ncbi:hypothetical protein GCM10011365_18410 [Marinicella pacifica]|uniref:Beta-lactamase class A catalytic domain-containing protein n=2 Tax=Marinicella pacifica TaxID=1171543 RepID=A0A917FS14_9GAMM|nr:hypothetical protein GCM10011365_18410 [Marinicella pacifica]
MIKTSWVLIFEIIYFVQGVMMKLVKIFLLLIVSGQGWSQIIFYNDFEVPAIQPLFPRVAGEFVLPNEPAANQLEWVVQQLSETSTSIADINAHFSSGFDANTLQNFFNTLRTDYPNGKITDIVGMTPMSTSVVVQGQDSQAKMGFFVVESRYTGSQKITYFYVSPYYGSVQYPIDQNLTMQQAVNKFNTLAADVGLLVAYVDHNNQCQPIYQSNSGTLKATGSIFKTWVLGGLADAVENNVITPYQNVTYDAGQWVNGGGVVNNEPAGTVFTAQDLAVLMLGVSDNTATEILHDVVGRSVIDAYIDSSGVMDATVLKPILSINEQFHLFFSIDPTTATNFINDTESNQLNFINTQLEPLGAVTSYPYQNDFLMTSGSWRASPMDVCQNFAHLRTYPQGSDALALIERAMGAQTAQPEIRNNWDRSWYKGGSLVSGVNGYHVLTHAWLLEDNGHAPYVVVAMANDDNGGIDNNNGIYKIQSVLARILELTREGL